MNTAKVYLTQIRTLETKIKQLINECEDLKNMASGNSSPRLDPNKVQTSGSGDAMARNVEKLVDLEKDVARQINTLANLKRRIINEIHELDDWRYITILHERYVNYKRLEEIAVMMNYSYERVRHLHGKALDEFARAHKLAHHSTG